MSIQNFSCSKNWQISVEFVQEIKWCKIFPGGNETKIVTEAISVKKNLFYICSILMFFNA